MDLHVYKIEYLTQSFVVVSHFDGKYTQFSDYVARFVVMRLFSNQKVFHFLQLTMTDVKLYNHKNTEKSDSSSSVFLCSFATVNKNKPRQLPVHF